jgi:putative hydrolase of the HAD superfamily
MPRTSRSTVKLALFDLDNTLFDRAGAYRTWATRYVEAMGFDRDEIEWFCSIDEDGFADRHDIWTRAKERFRLTEPIDQLLSAYRQSVVETWTPDDHVLEALSLLREQGWRIGIVTNGPMPQQSDKAERLGLLPFVDGFCGSGELGIEKPDRRIFEEAIRRCAAEGLLASESSWMVGDAPSPDIGGGRAVGLRTIWLHRGRRWNLADGEAPDVTVGSIADAVREILSRSSQSL